MTDGLEDDALGCDRSAMQRVLPRSARELALPGWCMEGCATHSPRGDAHAMQRGSPRIHCAVFDAAPRAAESSRCFDFSKGEGVMRAFLLALSVAPSSAVIASSSP